jgi:hypothetical protein
MMSPRARRSGLFRLVVVATVVLFVLLTRGRRSMDNQDAMEPASAADEARYVPAGDEGLGASVAILIDNSGSMDGKAGNDARPKNEVAHAALEAMLSSTDSFVARQPGFPINVGLYRFSTRVTRLVPIQRYDRAALVNAIEGIPGPDGGTAIGDAMEVAVADLYRAGTIRKYILVVTDGENTDGRSPRSVASEIARRSEGAVRMYFVAFDVDEKKFSFVRDVRGEVLAARDGRALIASLDTIYRGRILAEAVDAGETLPSPPPAVPPRADSGHSPSRPNTP